MRIAGFCAAGLACAPTRAVMRPGSTADFVAAIEEQRAKVAAVAQAVKRK